MTEAADNKDSSSPPAGRGIALAYETTPLSAPRGSRRWWVYAVVGGYLLLVAVLLSLPAWVGLFGDASSHDMAVLVICIASVVLSGLSLVLVPVRKARRRPVTRRSIWIPIIGSGALAAVLALGASLALSEYFQIAFEGGGSLVLAVGAVWAGWTGIFGIIAMRGKVEGVGSWLHRSLIAGSALELLVAVPCHIVVRRRHDCCAGIGTGTGICLGIVVMFVALGPSVLLLFYRRKKQLMGEL